MRIRAASRTKLRWPTAAHRSYLVLQVLLAVLLVTGSGYGVLGVESAYGAASHAHGGHAASASQPSLSPGEGEGSSFCAGVDPAVPTVNLGASFDNVYACGPEPGYTFPSYGDVFQPQGGFQCTELANRFLWAHWGIEPVYGDNLTGADYAQTVEAANPSIPLIKNGTVNQPYEPGDIVSFTGNSDDPAGHVAVVAASTEDASGNGTVTILEENSPTGPKGEETLQVSNWSLLSAPGSYVTPYEFLGLARVAPTITTSALPGAQVGAYYSAELSATGGAGPYAWRLTSGSLPAGLALSPGGVLSGIPTSGGNYSVSVSVSGSNGASTEKTLELVVGPGGNLLLNASFERGQLGAWSLLPVSGGTMYWAAYDNTPVPEGQWYLEFNTSTVDGSVYQDVPAELSAGQSYTFSTWLRTDSGAKTAQVCVALWGLGAQTENGITCKTIGPTWTQVSVPYDVSAAGAGGNTLRAQVYLNTVGVNLDLNGSQLSDQSQVIEATSSAATGGYWILASSGGVYNFDAPWYGSPKAGGAAAVTADPVVGIAANGSGYDILRANGGVDNYGTSWHGSLAGQLPAGVHPVAIA